MRTTLKLLLLLLLSVAFFLLYRTHADLTTVTKPTPTPIDVKTPKTNTFSNGTFKVIWVVLSDKSKISLYSNLTEKQSSQELATLNNCETLISGGFYTKEDKHIGLFYSGGKSYSVGIKSKLYNGFLSLTNTGEFTISDTVPSFPLNFSVQSGPLLMTNGKPLEIDLQGNEEARRVVAAVNDRNEIVFLVVFDQGNAISGPTLESLPEIISETSTHNHLNLKDALNLDGGAHSVFSVRGEKITEISPIGSYFCIRP